MLTLFVLIGKLLVFSTLAVAIFWAIQIRFGSIDDLDKDSPFVRLLRKKDFQQANRQAAPDSLASIEQAVIIVKEAARLEPVGAIPESEIQEAFRKSLAEYARIRAQYAEELIYPVTIRERSRTRKSERKEPAEYPEDVFTIPGYRDISKAIH